ncbi:MAG: GntR family transcriptional regulator [Proteobacteria bacterium]|nr:GntR family transcriptional regulator [Pseudomonadota bacterium]
MIKKSKKRPASDHTKLAHDGIKDLLFNNQIVPGQKISYKEIADRLDMSLTPVVQALKIMEYQGLVKHTPNKGFYAVPLSLQEIEEIYDLRKVIETSMLPKVISNLSIESINRLKNILEKNNDRTIDLNDRLIMDRNFHITLSSISGQKIQIQILQNLFDLLYLKYRGSLLFVASETVVGSQHQLIFEAVITRDLELAINAMEEHFTIVSTKALSTLSQILAGKKNQPPQPFDTR